MKTSDFDYQLPAELIAQQPLEKREVSRMMVIHRHIRSWEHSSFLSYKNYLRPGDLLVVNNAKVIPARLRARKIPTEGRVEILLLEPSGAFRTWKCLLKPGKRVSVGTRLFLTNTVQAEVCEITEDGQYHLTFTGEEDLIRLFNRIGEPPLPPYIRREASSDWTRDKERYQTVFARHPGAVAAPTAGLHFTTEYLEEIRSLGVGIAEVTLNVGLGTFLPVKTENLADHKMHEESFEISQESADQINLAKDQKRRVIAIGTTSLRTLESSVREGRVKSGTGRTGIFIHPPFEFQIVDALLTNFHLPQSTLLMLVSAFAAPGSVEGIEFMLAAYREAVVQRYRFFSYGDCMFIH